MVSTCTHDTRKKFGKTKSGAQRFRCCDCGKTFTVSTSTLGGQRIGTDKAAEIIRCMMEGVGVRAISRLTGVSKGAILKLLVRIGGRCKRFMESRVVNVPVKDVQADELWSFVYCKERTRKSLSLPLATFGDQYCFVGMERTSKLILAWHMGNREMVEGEKFIEKLGNACWRAPFQITTDGWMSYKTLIPREMEFAHFGMLIKIYAAGQDTTRYSPAQIMETKKKVVCGMPEESRMCTSHIERTNLTIRMQLRRFTRLTNGFSRKFENHEAALGLFFAFYNFCQVHGTLGTTPAVAAGLTDRRWTVEELIEESKGFDFEPPARLTGLAAFVNGLPEGE